jgi:hypothetical protein
MLPGKGEKIVAVYPVLASGKLKCRQITLLNPAQNGNLTDPAISGYGTGGKIDGVHFILVFRQVPPPLD